MNSPGESEIEPQLAKELLALPSPEQQIRLLENADFLNIAGISSLLNHAAELTRINPAQGRQLAIACTWAAREAGLEQVIPRSAYIQAQTYALAGQFPQALDLIRQSHDGYLALGEELAAMRTTAGLMHVLGESGQYQEALAAGQNVLDKINPAEQPELAAAIQQNMGLCYNHIGLYDEALEAYNAAEGIYLALGMTARAGDISNNRGILLWEMGRGSAALAALENALTIRAEAGLTMLQAQTWSNIGSAQLLLGHYTQSLEAFEQARRLFASLDILVDQHVLLLDTANAYLTLNLFPEALTAYQEADRMLESAGAVLQRGRALWGLGATLLNLGQLERAGEALSAAAALLEKTSEAPTPLLAAVLLEQAAVQAAGGHSTAAMNTAVHALNLVSDNDWPVPAIFAHLQLADLASEDLSQAEAHLLAAQQQADPLNLPQFRYRLQQRFGRLRRLQGRYTEAQAYLEDAIHEIERLRGTLAQETMRTSFLHDKVAAYNELITLHLDHDNEQGLQQAFAIAEQAKSRTLLDMISGVMETKRPQAANVEMTTHLRELQADLNAVYNEMLNRGGMEGAEGQYHVIQARAAELEHSIKQLQLRTTTAGESADMWAAPRPFSEIQAQLQADESLLAYHIIEDEILAFVVSKSSIHVSRQISQASQVQALLRRLVGLMDRMKAGLSFTPAQMAMLELSARRVLAVLYQALVAPLESALKGTVSANGQDVPQKLILIPHGCLHQVPFHALFDEQRYLIDRFEISYAPSASIYVHCQERPYSARNKALILGVPDPSIPAVLTEVQAVMNHLPSARSLLDQQATLAALQAGAADCQLLHLACHGLFRADNPMFSALKLHDGWLTAYDAMQLDLTNALVTLSACESGRALVTGGDETIGLLRAFLGAGAATVVVSLWLAQDESTAQLMSAWYRHLQDQPQSPAAALRAAQLALKSECPHPYYWASFIAVGKR